MRKLLAKFWWTETGNTIKQITMRKKNQMNLLIIQKHFNSINIYDKKVLNVKPHPTFSLNISSYMKCRPKSLKQS